jgi:long-chain acyl-CoA synthetase
VSATNLWDAFTAVATAAPERPALIDASGTTTFGALLRRAADYRDHFLRSGLERNDRVLLWTRNSPEIAAALLGTWGAGGIAALLDSSSRAPQLQHAIGRVEPRFLVHEDTPPDVPGPARIATALVQASNAALTPRTPVQQTDAASIMFTSGSTGRPKGVVQSHGNILRGSRAVAGYLGIGADDRLLCPVPWGFDYAFVQLHFTLTLGVTQVIVTQANPFNVCAAITAHRPTAFAGLPALYTFLLRGVSPLAQTDVSSVRLLTSSGGTVPAPVLRDLRSAFSGARLFLNYGLTETYRSAYLDPDLIDARYPCLGQPIPGADVVVVRDDGSLAAPGEEGELVHRGDYICLGYWGDAEATARAIRPDPLAPGERALFTGDLGRKDGDGFLYFVGRRDQQLKSMGVRVSPGEVEALLHESNLVREAAVFGMPHDMLGHEVWAAATPAAGVTELQRKLTAYARDAMSQYMQPRRWLIMDTLPKTATGKIDYPALKAEAALSPSAKIT